MPPSRKRAAAPSGRRKTVTFTRVARATRLPADLVRRVLRDDPTLVTDTATKDLVFRTARALGYDFPKLRMGRRLTLRQEAIQEVLHKIMAHPEWDRPRILAYLANAIDISQRVRQRMFGKDA